MKDSTRRPKFRRSSASGERTGNRRSKRGRWDCPTGKQRYRDHEHAVDALFFAKSMRRAAAALGFDSVRKEARTYRCGLCQGWHLTKKQDLVPDAV